MSFVTCPFSIVPVRKEPGDRAELVTQWLFGETATVLEREAKWSRLRFTHDTYEGWVDNKQMTTSSAELPASAMRSAEASVVVNIGGTELVLPMGAVVQFPDEVGPAMATNGTPKTKGQTSRDLKGPANLIAMQLTRKFIGVPYLWGGRTPWGVDCSGFIQMIYLLGGVQLPRDAYQQAEVGAAVGSLDLAEPGDLAFFDNDDGRITHVGFVLPGPNGVFIVHASGHVRLDNLDQEGILHMEEKRYSHKLRTIKRVVSS